MSGTMRIRFASDTPIAAVEILSPELETVKQFAIQPGTEEQVQVPSERSFIRVHLPSGRIVTLRHDGSLNYEISRSTFEGRLRHQQAAALRRAPISMQEIKGYHSFRSAIKTPFDIVIRDGVTIAPEPKLVLPGAVRAEWEPKVHGQLSIDGREIAFILKNRSSPYTLRVFASGTRLVVSLPGNLNSAYVRVDEVGEGGRVISIRASTTSNSADTVGAYLARGDYYAAETMAPSANQAAEMILDNMSDPYVATVGAYLLLRLERFDLMREWAYNLAKLFPFLSDGCVISAWQKIRQENDPDAASKYLVEAGTRGLPVHTEGLRLLSEGLRLIGRPGVQALDNLSILSGRVVWNSPFTARLEGTPDSTSITTTFNIGYIPDA